jgi:tRNA A-37 threonylcarbamoyl transferase component Bud32
MNEPMPTPCPEWEEKLAAFNLANLLASEREALDFHLQSCSACAAVFADYQRLDLLIDQALTSDLPLELPGDFAAGRHQNVTDIQHFEQMEGDDSVLRAAEMIVEQVQQGQALSDENDEHRHRERLPAHRSRYVTIANCRLKRIVEKEKYTTSYLGEHVHLNKPVVVKLHHKRLSDNERQSFQREAAQIASLSHPNIQRILEFGIHEEKPYLIMDHAPNSSLRELHPRGLPVPLPTIASYVKKIADALQYAHDRKIIHRNIRPENILVGPDNQILLTDFGIPALQSNLSSMTITAAGAHFYMAPEQFHGKHHVASDQYALAVMVYEWLSGERPFYGSVTEIATKHRESPPPLLHKKVSELSPAIEQVVLKALAKKPEMRFKSVREFATALEEATAY